MTDKPTAPKLGIVPPSPTPNDALDIEALWMDPALGDGLIDTNWHTIPVDKPKSPSGNIKLDYKVFGA